MTGDLVWIDSVRFVVMAVEWVCLGAVTWTGYQFALRRRWPETLGCTGAAVMVTGSAILIATRLGHTDLNWYSPLFGVGAILAAAGFLGALARSDHIAEPNGWYRKGGNR